MSPQKINITEEECKIFLSDLKWGGKPTCPSCGKDSPYLMARGNYRCSRNICKKDFSITSNTVFGSLKLPLCTWFYASFLFCEDKNLTSTKLAEIINVQQRTAWNMLNKFKIANKYEENNKNIIKMASEFTASRL